MEERAIDRVLPGVAFVRALEPEQARFGELGHADPKSGRDRSVVVAVVGCHRRIVGSSGSKLYTYGITRKG
jgi:hypothetical protein